MMFISRLKKISRVLPSLLLAALVVAVGAIDPSAAAEETAFDRLGPAPRDARGRFTNPVGNLTHGTFGVRFPFMWRRLGGAFRDDAAAPRRIPNDGAFLRENARHSQPTVTWIGHATVLVQMDHLTFLTDPIWSDKPSPISFMGPRRYVAPGVEFDLLPPIDFVVISHNHYDHLDLPTLRALAERSPETIFYVPLGNGDLLRQNEIKNVQELDWGQIARHEGVEVHCLPAQHWSKRGIGDDNEALWASWAVTGLERRFYFAGDTGYFNGFEKIGRRLGPFDVAAVPIGAYAPREMMRSSHMNPAEAAHASQDLQARRALGVHFGTFDLSDEPLDEPPRLFREAISTDHNLESEPWILEIGETREF